jgi:hypothetical protein
MVLMTLLLQRLLGAGIVRHYGLDVEDHLPTPQRQHQSQERRRIIERHDQRSDEHRSASHDAEPAHDVAPARATALDDERPGLRRPAAPQTERCATILAPR